MYMSKLRFYDLKKDFISPRRLKLTSNFSDVPLPYKDCKDILAHKVILPARNMSRSNSQFLGVTMYEFMQIVLVWFIPTTQDFMTIYSLQNMDSFFGWLI